MAMFNFDIPSLRKQSVMQDWGQPAPQQGYDWSQPNVDYSGGEMPQMQVPYPTPSMGPYETQPPRELFGREPTPTVPDPTAGPTIAPNSASGQAGMGAPRQITPHSYRDTLDLIDQAYKPDFTDRDRLRALMDAAPERQSPGWGRGLSAIALGIGSKSPEEGLKAQEAVLFAPHRRAMADWTAKSEPFLKTAELEGRQNVNERTLTGNVISADTQARRIEENARQADQKNEVAQEKNRVARLRAEIAGRDEYIVSARGPTIIVTNKNTGQPTDTGIKTGWMSEADKVEAEGGWKVEASRVTGEAAAGRARASGAGRVVIGDQVYEPDPDDPNKMIKVQGLPAGTPTKIGTPRAADSDGGELEKNRVEQGKLEDLWTTDRDGAREFIQKGTNGKYEWKKRPVPREDSWFPGDQSIGQDKVDNYDRARKSADPTYVPPKSAAAPPPPKEAAPTPKIGSRVEAGAPMFPEVKVKPESKTGLGPQNVPEFGSPTTIDVRSGVQARAADVLRKAGKPVTQANIDAVIKAGRVK